MCHFVVLAIYEKVENDTAKIYQYRKSASKGPYHGSDSNEGSDYITINVS